MRVAVYGLWHLGCVTAACLATAGHETVGLDLDEGLVDGLGAARPPLHEPGLAELVAGGLASGRLSFTTRPAEALRSAAVLWVTFDTPVNERDEADVGYVRARVEAIADAVAPGTLVLISSQVPVGFSGALERDWQGRGVRFAYAAENLRLGRALESFQRPDRVIIGRRRRDDEPLLAELFAPFCQRIEWMSVESAEMAKHALNGFLATSVTFINELARLCEAVGADAKEVERGLRSEPRIGPRAYLAPGAAFAGGTLARDVRFLTHLGRRQGVPTPLFDKVRCLLAGLDRPVAAVLGLTYKPGTSTLRRSASVELCARLAHTGVRVQAHDPAVGALPNDLGGLVRLCPTPAEALAGADLAVLATEWPEYRALTPEDFLGAMRKPRIVDQSWFLAATLADDPRLTYVAPGRAPRD